MGSVFEEYKEKKSDMEILMDDMRIPVGSFLLDKPEPADILLVTSEMLREVINAGEREITKPSKYLVEIQDKMRQILGVDLAGYFKVEVDNRCKDSIIRLLFKAAAIGIGVGKGENVQEAWMDAVTTGIQPSLEVLREDINKILGLLPKEDCA